ncbi:phospholipid-transporting ATPase ABCA1-like, partial [Corticium candelabrum]|uniref:phospholipid-transporting ATPase ABCA1-like n=1 Tax=Corticium candelabrum TaxID=121492 RepID=UPI002E260F2D
MRETLRKLKLLLWKNFTLKRRQPLIVAVEIVWPLVLMIIVMIIRQSRGPINQSERTYIPRGMPSAGLTPFLQGAVCDPVANMVFKEGNINDTYGFYDFNPAITALLHNVTLMLQDPTIDITRLTRIQHDAQLVQSDIAMLNDMLSKSDDPQKAIQYVGLPVVSDSSGLTLDRIANDPSELRDFLVHRLNFSSADADVFVTSAIDVQELQVYTLRSTTEQYVQCRENLLRCALTLQNGLGSVVSASGNLNPLEILLNSGLLKQLGCGNSDAFARIFTFPTNESQVRVQHRLCSLTSDQAQALAEKLNVTKLQQAFTTPADTPFSQRIRSHFREIAEDYNTTQRMLPYLVEPIRKLAEDFPSNADIANMSMSQLSKLFVCTLCRQSQDNCRAANTKPLENHRWSRAHDGTTVAGRLLQGIEILYAPDLGNNSHAVRDVIHEANRTFAEIEDLKRIINSLIDSQKALDDIINRDPNSTYTRSIIRRTCQPLTSSTGSQDCNFSRILNVMEGFRDVLNKIQIKWIGYPNQTMLEEAAAFKSRSGSAVWAGIVFENLDENGTLGKHVRYTIKMNETLVDPPNKLRKVYWKPGPESYQTHTMYETFGFVYIKDMVDRGIINVLTNKTVVEPGGYLQRFPYPCYIYDKFASALSAMMPMFMSLAWVFSVSMVVRNVVYEKEERLKEMMKIMGLPSLSLWLSWFVTSFVIMGFSALILTILMTAGDVLMNSNFLLVYLFFLNFTAATIMLCFVISTMFNKANLAALSGGLMYMFTYLPFIIYVTNETEFGFMEKSVLCLLSTTAFGAASTYVSRYEEQGIGIQWDNMGKSVLPGDEFSFLTANLFLLLDTILYAIIVWYIDNVFPGQYGVPRPWYFPFQKSYWAGVFGCSKVPSKQLPMMSQNGYATVPLNCDGEDMGSPSVSAEADPTHLHIGVSIKNLVKVYGGHKRAVDNLSLNFYEGQITSFLGHNGAGKTTTMSVLCGLYPPTSGKAYIRGMDITTSIDEIRKTLGLCPQQNVLYNKLTVTEHLWLIAKLKNVGVSDKELKKEIDKWLDDLNLTEKRNAMVSSLSGGMKRKLSVAMAYVGGSKVVILDEPTAGVDPYARRGIWDLMIKHRENRTVILSTHYMDEADVLGDRIAIISHGKLCCVGSSLYLKRQFSDGYYLTVAKQLVGSMTSLALCSNSGSSLLVGNTLNDKSGSLPTLSNVRSASLSGSGPVHVPDLCQDADAVSYTDGMGMKPLVGGHRRNRSEGSVDAFVEDFNQKKKSKSKKSVDSMCVTDKVTDVVTSHIPEAQLMEDIGTEINYLLPSGAANGHQLSLLLSNLDKQKAKLGVAGYGMSDTSLEEVFLKVTNEAEETQPDPTTGASILNKLRRKRWRWLKRKQSSSHSLEARASLVCDGDEEFDGEGSDDDDEVMADETAALTSDIESGLEESRVADCYGDAGTCTVTGHHLLLQQFKASFIKRFHNSRRYTKGIIAQLILPAIFICVALVFKLFAPQPSNGTIELTPSVYPGDMYIPFKNFQPWQQQATNLTASVAQPCGGSAHYLVNSISKSRCHQYLAYVASHRHTPNKYWSVPASITAPVNATCSCASGKQQCPSDIVAPSPPSLLTVDDLTLQDLVDKKNMTDYILKSTDEYILHRYGGVSFGHENLQFGDVSSQMYGDALSRLGVRRAAKAWYTNK